MNRAAWSAGLWASTAYVLGYATGANISLYDCAVDGAVMGGSSLGSDYVHQAINVQPTGLTSAAMTGAIFALAQRGVRGSDAYAVNFVAGAGNDFLVEWVGSMYMARQAEMAA
jgi:hypothetical protein